jgi:bla regulator protein blaR1
MIGELTNHLWQSTIFAVVAGFMTVAFRKNQAQVRYWLWLSASLKFLLPFSLLMSLGNRLEWAPATQNMATAPAVTLTMVQMSQPFPDTLPLPPPTRGTHDWAAIAIFGVWAFGFSGVALTRFRGWLRIRAAVRSSSPFEIPASVEVRSSPGLLEPGVVGLFRPILLLPAGIVERLKPRQLEAVLAHELCHVRRRDNLTSAIHMMVEAVFWFHPLVWWIGARLVEERERACDEAVLSLGSAPHDYAEGILKVCKSYLESPLSCVSGVTGSNLKKRIEAILAGRVGCDLNFSKKLALIAAGTTALAAPIAVGIVGAPAGRAQSQLATPKFEMTSIKSCPAFRKGTLPGWSPGRELHSECTTVQRLIQQAYGLFANAH